MNWFVTALKNYAVFSGRSRRSEYWYFGLFYLIFYAAAAVVDVMFGSFERTSGIGVCTAIVALALLIPSISVTVRRLHDTGRSGWWLLIGFIPLVGGSSCWCSCARIVSPARIASARIPRPSPWSGPSCPPGPRSRGRRPRPSARPAGPWRPRSRCTPRTTWPSWSRPTRQASSDGVRPARPRHVCAAPAAPRTSSGEPEPEALTPARVGPQGGQHHAIARDDLRAREARNWRRRSCCSAGIGARPTARPAGARAAGPARRRRGRAPRGCPGGRRARPA